VTTAMSGVLSEILRRYACATGFMSARTDFKHEVTAERGSLRRPQACAVWKEAVCVYSCRT
jgi:hypothetical protein